MWKFGIDNYWGKPCQKYLQLLVDWIAKIIKEKWE
jgi:hypothetical protein